MNDKEVIMNILSSIGKEKTTVMSEFYQKRGMLGRTGKTKPLFYVAYKQLLDEGLIEEEKRGNTKWVQKVSTTKTEEIDSLVIAKREAIRNNQIIDAHMKELTILHQQRMKERRVLEQYIEYLQDQIKTMKQMELHRLNSKQNDNMMEEDQ